jgi:hypothetical protein
MSSTHSLSHALCPAARAFSLSLSPSLLPSLVTLYISLGGVWRPSTRYPTPGCGAAVPTCLFLDRWPGATRTRQLNPRSHRRLPGLPLSGALIDFVTHCCTHPHISEPCVRSGLPTYGGGGGVSAPPCPLERAPPASHLSIAPNASGPETRCATVGEIPAAPIPQARRRTSTITGQRQGRGTGRDAVCSMPQGHLYEDCTSGLSACALSKSCPSFQSRTRWCCSRLLYCIEHLTLFDNHPTAITTTTFYQHYKPPHTHTLTHITVTGERR